MSRALLDLDQGIVGGGLERKKKKKEKETVRVRDVLPVGRSRVEANLQSQYQSSPPSRYHSSPQRGRVMKNG